MYYSLKDTPCYLRKPLVPPRGRVTCLMAFCVNFLKKIIVKVIGKGVRYT